MATCNIVLTDANGNEYSTNSFSVDSVVYMHVSASDGNWHVDRIEDSDSSIQWSASGVYSSSYIIKLQDDADGREVFQLSEVTTHAFNVILRSDSGTCSISESICFGNTCGDSVGTITVDQVVCGENSTLTATPECCYEVSSWINGDGVEMQTGGNVYTYSLADGTNISITAVLALKTFDLYVATNGSTQGYFNVTRVRDGVTTEWSDQTAATVDVKCGDTITLEAVANSGYAFDNWEYDSGQVSTSTYTFTFNSTNFTNCAIPSFTANFTAMPQYSVIYHNNISGGTDVAYTINGLHSGDTFTLADPEEFPTGTVESFRQSHYYISSWGNAASAPTESHSIGDTYTMEDGDVNFYAIWAEMPTYTITYYAIEDDGIDEAGTTYSDSQNKIVDVVTGVYAGDTVTLRNSTDIAPAKNTELKGWAINSTSIVSSPTRWPMFEFSQTTFVMPAGNVSLYAYSYDVENSYPMRFHNNGGTSISGEGVMTILDTGRSNSGSPGIVGMDYLNTLSYNVSAPSFSDVFVTPYQSYAIPSGYRFTGWNSSADGTGVAFDSSNPYLVNSSYTSIPDFYAQWTALASCVVVLNANGGTFNETSYPSEKTVALTYGDTMSLTSYSSSAFRTGYTLLGWSEDSAATTATYGVSGVVSVTAQTITLYAVWQLSTTYTVTYVLPSDTTSGTAPSAQTVYSGGSVTVKAASGVYKTGVPDNYTIGRWSATVGGETVYYTIGSTISNIQDNITLTGVWESCEMTFTTSSGKLSCDDVVIASANETVTLNLMSDQHTVEVVESTSPFAGWILDETGLIVDCLEGEAGEGCTYRYAEIPYTATVEFLGVSELPVPSLDTYLTESRYVKIDERYYQMVATCSECTYDMPCGSTYNAAFYVS